MLAELWASLQERVESPVYALLAAALVLAVMLTFAMARCAPSAPVPALVGAQLQAHAAHVAADSQKLAAADSARVVAARRDAELAASAARGAAAVRRQHATAEALGAAAAAETNAGDSATAYAAAYAARTAEAVQQDSLIGILATDTAVKARQLALADTGAGIVLGQIRSTDSLVAAILPLTTGGEHCRILGLFACPSRTHVMIATAAVTVAAVLLARPAGHALIAQLDALPRARAGLEIRLAGVGWR